jgi:hypothetical protein
MIPFNFNNLFFKSAAFTSLMGMIIIKSKQMKEEAALLIIIQNALNQRKR